jgi:hypothetical protein
MPRKTFDMLLSSAGVILTIVLVVGGFLAFWGYSFATNEVETQLRAQRIYFPDPGDEQFANPEIGPYIEQYAGQQVVNGEQARAFADHYIAVHLQDVNNGKTYAETSAESRANPEDEELAAAVQTLFRGETLRGLLLNAYAFWKLGALARIGAFVAWGLAALMALFSILGFWHVRRVEPTKMVLAPSEGPREEQLS